MDEHRKLAEEILQKKHDWIYDKTCGNGVSLQSHIANALRTLTEEKNAQLRTAEAQFYKRYKELEKEVRSTSSKSEKDGWNKAVKECSDIVWNWSHPDTVFNDRCVEMAAEIRKLIREDGK